MLAYLVRKTDKGKDFVLQVNSIQRLDTAFIQLKKPQM